MRTNYDESKDVTIATDTIYLGDNKFLEISVKRYDSGEPKIQIIRYKLIKDGTAKSYEKLGRLTKFEYQALQELMNKFEEHTR